MKNLLVSDDGTTAVIALSNGLHCIVDSSSLPFMAAHKWHVARYTNNFNTYAATTMRDQNGKKHNVALHRFLTDAVAREIIDHKNGNGLDNRLDNLRKCTNQQNKANGRKRRGAVSPYKGVTYDGKRTHTKPWRARIRVFGKLVDLGRYSDPLDAARAYDVAAVLYFGEFARINDYEQIASGAS